MVKREDAVHCLLPAKGTSTSYKPASQESRRTFHVDVEEETIRETHQNTTFPLWDRNRSDRVLGGVDKN